MRLNSTNLFGLSTARAGSCKDHKHMLVRKFLILLCMLVITSSVQAESALNALTEKEKHADWQLLFDGRTTKGWMTVAGEHLPERHVQDGSLNPHPCDYMPG